MYKESGEVNEFFFNFFFVCPTLKSAVVSMCLPSGLQRTAQSPAEPSSILQVHSGCSMDQTCNMTKPFLTVIPFKKKHKQENLGVQFCILIS